MSSYRICLITNPLIYYRASKSGSLIKGRPMQQQQQLFMDQNRCRSFCHEKKNGPTAIREPETDFAQLDRNAKTSFSLGRIALRTSLINRPLVTNTLEDWREERKREREMRRMSHGDRKENYKGEEENWECIGCRLQNVPRNQYSFLEIIPFNWLCKKK